MPEAPALSLTPIVSGRLATTEANVIEAIRAGTPFRTTVSLEPKIALAAVRAAASEKRELSNFLEVALAGYVEQHGPAAPEDVELMSKLLIALKKKPHVRAALEKFYRDKLRAA